MIETLQRKFVLTAMTAISVLLLVLLGAIASHAFGMGRYIAGAARFGGKGAEGFA